MDKFGSISSLSLWFLICIQILSRPNISFSAKWIPMLFLSKIIHDKALTDQMSYQWLYYLSEKIGGQIANLHQSMAAIEFTKQILDIWVVLKFSPYLLKLIIGIGAKEQVRLINHQKFGNVDLNALA